MSSPLSFRSNIAWTLLGQVFNVVSQFLIVVIIARVSDVEALGLYGILSAIVGPIQLFMMFDLGKLVVANDRFENIFGSYHIVIIVSCILVPIVSMIVCFAIYHDVSMLPAMASFSLYRALVNYREFCFSIYQKFERLDLMAMSTIYLSVGTIIIFGLSYFFFQNIAISFFSISSYFLIGFILFELPKLKKFLLSESKLLHFEGSQVLEVLQKGLKLGATAFINGIKSNAPRYIIEFAIQNRSLLGVYTGFLQFSNTLNTLNQAMSKSSIGRLSNLHVVDLVKFKRFLNKMIISVILIGMAVTLIVVLFGVFITRLSFDNPEFSENNSIFVLIILARAIAMPIVYLRNAQTILGIYSSQLFYILSSMVFFVILCYMLIPIFDHLGVLYALAISEFMVLVLSYVSVRRELTNN
ncbi:oligosaccharide flippase family protein [Imperialibacter roseus]|uniref:Oligosaccharide flippase family protein n=1 Tax=Imperialibacter roseus TaxID=1324217 RepID=A0ABZ0IPJ0_9BACT|nr:oligosaccharide flippase family protein [Imperialibacter roseus]WOK06275.1 oligosaccharide flippase family protein [Imperialibacter roseus]